MYWIFLRFFLFNSYQNIIIIITNLHISVLDITSFKVYIICLIIKISCIYRWIYMSVVYECIDARYVSPFIIHIYYNKIFKHLSLIEWYCSIYATKFM